MRTNKTIHDPELRRLLARLLCRQKQLFHEQRRRAELHEGPWLAAYHTGVMRGLREMCAEVCLQRGIEQM